MIILMDQRISLTRGVRMLTIGRPLSYCRSPISPKPYDVWPGQDSAGANVMALMCKKFHQHMSQVNRSVLYHIIQVIQFLPPHHPNIVSATYNRFGNDNMHILKHQPRKEDCLRHPQHIVASESQMMPCYCQSNPRRKVYQEILILLGRIEISVIKTKHQSKIHVAQKLRLDKI